MDWNQLQDASGDGRGRPATIDPALLAIAPGTDEVFGPFKSKNSAKTSMANYSDRAAAAGLLFEGPATDGTAFYFRAYRPAQDAE